MPCCIASESLRVREVVVVFTELAGALPWKTQSIIVELSGIGL